MNRLSRFVFLILATTILVPSATEATALLSNFGEPFLLDGDTPISGEQWAAQSFITNGSSHQLSWIDVILGNRIETPTILAELRVDDGAGSPGSLLTTFSLPLIPEDPRQTVRLTPTSLATLAQNTAYWLVLGVTSSAGSFEWAHAEGTGHTGTGDIGPLSVSLDDGVIWDNFPNLTIRSSWRSRFPA